MNSMIIPSFLFFVLYVPYSTEGSRGCVPLDDLTFDKVVNNFEATLVKFDVAYPYGDSHDTFVNLGVQAQSVPQLLFAEVGIKDYGDKENLGLGERFNIVKEDFPVIMLFVNHGNKTRKEIKYSESITKDSIQNFIRQHSDIFLTNPGCIHEFDVLAKKFMAQSSRPEEMKKILREASDLLSSSFSKSESSKNYVNLMSKIIGEGLSFLPREKNRLSKILESKVSKELKEKIEGKINILESFFKVSNLNDEL